MTDTDFKLVVAILVFFFFSYKGMEDKGKYKTFLRLFGGIYFTAINIYLASQQVEKYIFGNIFFYISLNLPVMYTLLIKSRFTTGYVKYFEDGIYSLCVCNIIVYGFTIMALLGDIRYDYTWEDIHFIWFSMIWFYCHLPFIFDKDMREWFFRGFYLLPTSLIFINLLCVFDLDIPIVFWSYGVFFIVYIVIILFVRYRYFRKGHEKLK